MARTFALLSSHSTQEGQQAIKQVATYAQEPRPSVGYVSSETDHTRDFYHYTQSIYQHVGLTLGRYFDFETHYSDSAFDHLLSYPIVHLSGGSTFRFLRGITQRGAHQKLIDYVDSGGILIGLSAGAMVCTPSAIMALACDDDDTYHANETALKGLGLVPFHFLPHYPKQMIKQNVMQHAALSIARRFDVTQPLILCQDTQAIIVVNDEQHTIGSPLTTLKP